jgi:hypothetical protein
MTTTRIATLLAATVAAGMGLAALTSASAQDAPPRTLTLKQLDRGATFIHVRHSRKSSTRGNALGDSIVFTNPIVDTSGKRIGRSHAECVTTVGARDFRKSVLTCQAILRLPGGDLMGQFAVSPTQETVTGAITGGTGAYANARGVFVSNRTRTGSTDTITFAG